jgi:predicted NBD/HSP70 family sugar kinase
MKLGLDLTDSVIRAVIVSDTGQVLARADQPIAAGGLARALREVVKRTRSVSNLATILDPDAIVLGGVLADSGDMMLDSIRMECSRRLSPAQAERVRIVLSALGSDAVAIGAARMAAQPQT